MPPKQTQPFEMNRFSRGLITEASPLNFPADASVEEYNFTLDKDGTRRRRLGMNYEQDYVLNSTAYVRSDRYKLAISSFLWTNVGEDSTKEYVVLQIGSYLYFHGRENEVLSTAPAGTVTIGSAKTKVFSFASIDGDLIVANGTGNITRIEYDGGNFTKSTYRIRVRDQWGVEDVVDGKDLDNPTWINFRPESTTGAHNYNLHNQGWGLPRLVKEFDQQLLDPLDKSVSQFDYNKYPSNADIMHEWVRPDPEGSEQRTKFFSRDYQKEPPFTTPAAKGYFVIDLLLRGIDREGEFASNLLKHPELVTTLNGENLPQDETPGGCSVVSEYAGRVFYAGFAGEVLDGDEKSPRLSNYVAYSQLVDSPSQLGSCFQSGDPTSPDESDLLATDGGIIRISGAENIVDLKQVGRSLFVIATNGMWRISGGADEGFAADNFEVEKITEHGPVARESLVEVDNTFMFWADNGIYHVAPNQMGSWTATNVSNAVIQEYYDNIAPENKALVQGVFDRYERQVRWLFPYDQDQYNQELMEELVLDLELQAFVPARINNQAGGGKPTVQKYAVARPFTREIIEQDVVTDPDTVVVGAEDVIVGEETITGFENVPTIKYLTIQFTNQQTDAAMFYTFSEYNEESFRDWGSEDAAAYMVTGAFTGGDSSRHKQVPYMHFHMLKEQSCPEGNETLPDVCQEYSCDAYQVWLQGQGIDIWYEYNQGGTAPIVGASIPSSGSATNNVEVTVQAGDNPEVQIADFDQCAGVYLYSLGAGSRHESNNSTEVVATANEDGYTHSFVHSGGSQDYGLDFLISNHPSPGTTKDFGYSINVNDVLTCHGAEKSVDLTDYLTKSANVISIVYRRDVTVDVWDGANKSSDLEVWVNGTMVYDAVTDSGTGVNSEKITDMSDIRIQSSAAASTGTAHVLTDGRAWTVAELEAQGYAFLQNDETWVPPQGCTIGEDAGPECTPYGADNYGTALDAFVPPSGHQWRMDDPIGSLSVAGNNGVNLTDILLLEFEKDSPLDGGPTAILYDSIGSAGRARTFALPASGKDLVGGLTGVLAQNVPPQTEPGNFHLTAYHITAGGFEAQFYVGTNGPTGLRVVVTIEGASGVNHDHFGVVDWDGTCPEKAHVISLWHQYELSTGNYSYVLYVDHVEVGSNSGTIFYGSATPSTGGEIAFYCGSKDAIMSHGYYIEDADQPTASELEALQYGLASNCSSYTPPSYCSDLPYEGGENDCTNSDASCLVTTAWDHAVGSGTGRVSRQFQVYRLVRGTENNYSVVTTRNRIRGRGKSFFMRMDTEPDKACSILGWNWALTGNSHV